jgi:hypothetical protein
VLLEYHKKKWELSVYIKHSEGYKNLLPVVHAPEQIHRIGRPDGTPYTAHRFVICDRVRAILIVICTHWPEVGVVARAANDPRSG